MVKKYILCSECKSKIPSERCMGTSDDMLCGACIKLIYGEPFYAQIKPLFSKIEKPADNE